MTNATLNDIKSRVVEVETETKNVSDRIRELFDTSSCLRGLCDCMTFCRNVETQITDIIRQVTTLETKVKERDVRETERDKKLDRLLEDVIYMRGRQDVLQAQIGGGGAQAKVHSNKRKPVSEKSSYPELRTQGHETDQTKLEKDSERFSKSSDNRSAKSVKHGIHKKRSKSYVADHESETDEQSSDGDDSESNSASLSPRSPYESPDPRSLDQRTSLGDRQIPSAERRAPPVDQLLPTLDRLSSQETRSSLPKTRRSTPETRRSPSEARRSSSLNQRASSVEQRFSPADQRSPLVDRRPSLVDRRTSSVDKREPSLHESVSENQKQNERKTLTGETHSGKGFATKHPKQKDVAREDQQASVKVEAKHKQHSAANQPTPPNVPRLLQERSNDIASEPEPCKTLVPFATKEGTYVKPVPEVVVQTSKEYYLTGEVWEVQAKAEEQDAQKTPLLNLEAIKTILLIDTSQSMAAGDKWQHVQTFFYDYLSGVEQVAPSLGNLEHVAIVTFGAQTRCLQRYTNDFSVVRTAFETIQLGGPSPLFGGLMMAHAVSQTCKNDLMKLKNGMIVNTKIIMLTDGDPTEICLYRGPDTPDPDQMDETKALLLTMMEALEKEKQTLDLFCVPVGKADIEFLRLLFGREGGRKILNFQDGHYFSRRIFLSTKFERRFNFFDGNTFTIPQHDPEITSRDYAHMQEILDDDRVKTYEAMLRRERNPYAERISRNERILPIGSRVRRGPDWDSGDEDDNGPGTTVVDMVWVHWDQSDKIGQYHYGDIGRYSVLPVEEPRMPLPGQPLEVGCVVCPGKDWKSDVAPRDSRGVIYKIVNDKGTRKAEVRWSNGKRGLHSCGDRVHEIQISLTDVSVPTASGAQRLPSTQNSSQRLAIGGAGRVPEIEAASASSIGQSTNQSEERKKLVKNKNVIR